MKEDGTKTDKREEMMIGMEQETGKRELKDSSKRDAATNKKEESNKEAWKAMKNEQENEGEGQYQAEQT